MPRRPLIAAALGAACLACAAAPLELAAELSLKGWARPGRGAELALQLRAGTAARVHVEVAAGPQRSVADLDLQPGRPVRLHVPVQAAGPLVVTASLPGVASLRRELVPSPSESPLLGVALAVPAALALDGFHVVALAPADLPHGVAAYASVDALLLDASTLLALEPAQLAALLAHIAGCGRVAVLQADARVRGLLDGARGCGGQGLLHADTPAEAQQQLAASLARPMSPPMTRGALGELARPSLADWEAVVLALAACVALLALTLVLSASTPVLVAAPAFAAVVVGVWLRAATPQPQLVIWSEGDSGAQLARFQAWQRFPGLWRGSVRVAIPPQLAGAAQPCDVGLPVRLELDPQRSQLAAAEFETRLFRQVWFCSTGAFPMARAFDTDLLAGGMRQVRNNGSLAWPAGVLIVGGQAQSLPALGPGGALRLPVLPPAAPDEPSARAAAARLRPDATAALWPLELRGVAGAPRGAHGWLLVTAAAR